MNTIEVKINGYTYFVDIYNKIVYENREKSKGIPYNYLTLSKLEQIERQLRFSLKFIEFS